MSTKRIFEQDWFGKIGIVAREFGGPYLGVHIHRPKNKCQLYRVHEDDFQSIEIWDKLKTMVLSEKYVPLDKGYCKECGSPLQNWYRRYKHRRFCAFCGEDLTND